MDTFLNFAVPICTILLGVSAFFDNWSKYSQRPIFQGRPIINTEFLAKTSFKFSYFIIFTFLSLYLSKCNSDLSDKKSKNEIAQRDSANKRHDDSLQLEYKKDIRATNDSNINSFSKSLEAYNLAYNEQQKHVYSKIDSINKGKPSFDLVALSQREYTFEAGDTLYIRLAAINNGNCPINVSYRSYYAMNLNGEFYCEVSGSTANSEDFPIARTDTLRLWLANIGTLDTIYLYYLGSYSTERIKKPFSRMFMWVTKENRIGQPGSSDLIDSIEAKIKKKLRLK